MKQKGGGGYKRRGGGVYAHTTRQGLFTVFWHLAEWPLLGDTYGNQKRTVNTIVFI